MRSFAFIMLCALSILACDSKTKKTGDGAGLAPTQQLSPKLSSRNLLVGKFSAAASGAQLIAAGRSGPIGGTSLEVPAGSLSNDAEISILEGESLLTDLTTKELGLAETVGTLNEASSAIMVRADPSSTKLSTNFVLRLPLKDTYIKSFMVIGRYIKSDSGKAIFGVLANSSYALKNGVVEIQSTNFGVYQLIQTTGTPVTTATEVDSTTLPAAKGEATPVSLAPSAFSIKAPSGAMGSPSPLAIWTAAENALSYDVAIGSDPLCATPIQSYKGVQGTTTNLTALSADAVYFLCVTANGSGGLTTLATNNGLSFSISGPSPGRFRIKGAPDHLINTQTPKISWEKSVGASHYLMLVGTAAGCASPLQIYRDVKTESQTLAKLDPGTYVICLTAIDAINRRRIPDNNDYSVTIDTTPPGAFTITSLAYDATADAVLAKWGASAGAARYEVTIARDSTCTSQATTYKNVYDVQRIIPGVSGTGYYLCVTAYDEAGNTVSASNNGASFLVDPDGPPGPFTISAPAAKSYVATPTASWSAAVRATSYTVKVGGGIACDSPNQQTITGVTATSIALSTIPDGSYNICVTAIDVQGSQTDATNFGTTFETETSTVHIAYTTLISGTTNLRYAAYSGGTWSIDSTPIQTATGANSIEPRVSLTLDNTDKPQVAYALDTGAAIAMKFGRRTGANTWVTEIIEDSGAGAGTYGKFNAISLATDNTVKLTYVRDDTTNARIRFATGTTGSFTKSDIDATPATGTVSDTAIAMTTANQVEFIESVNTSGTRRLTYRNSSNFATTASVLANAACTHMLLANVDVDAANATHVAYACVTSGGACNVYYVKRSAGSFGTHELVGSIDSSGCTETQIESATYRPQIATDASNIPRIVWWDQGNGNLKYASRATGSWVVSTPVASGAVLGSVAQALDSFGNAYLFYLDNAGLKFTTNNASGSLTSWSTPVAVDSSVQGVGDAAVSGVAYRSVRP